MELTFAETKTPPLWEPDAPDMEVWSDRYGVPCAYGQVVGNESWMHIPRVGSFLLGDGVEPTAVVPLGGVPRWLVLDTFYRTVMPTALQLNGCEVLHASAVVFEEGVVALCAPSETGKSTLAYALKERGNPLYADDAVVFRCEGDGPRLQQVPYSIRLRRPSAEHFGAAPREATRVSGEIPPIDRAASTFAAIFVLERSADEAHSSPAAVARLTPAQAFPQVLPHAYCFTLRDPARKSLMMRQYLTLLRYVPVFSLRFRTGLRYLDEIAESIERAVETLAGDVNVVERV